jgi:hypothetical protein
MWPNSKSGLKAGRMSPFFDSLLGAMEKMLAWPAGGTVGNDETPSTKTAIVKSTLDVYILWGREGAQ